MTEPTLHWNRLADKVAIVTGAGAEASDIGIGRAIAYIMGREGASVVCADLDLSRAQATAAMIEEAGGTAIALAGDVSRPGDCEALVKAAIERFGNLDILINNVGVSVSVKLAEVTLEQWNRTLEINLTSVMLMSKFAIPQMARHGGGAIVNISSIAGMRAMGSLVYGPSKAAMAQLSRELGVLHGRQGIRVNTVAPGHVMTPHAMAKVPAPMREARRKVGPLGIEGDAWDIAQAVLFLASDEARFINGVHLAVDGGVEGIGPLTGHAFVTEA
ncbi:NAD(P)-dependent dehydrogenase (short-subunit alcohol dehydrogenase family) [Sphingobium sp. AEW010]|nr:NAD(P)-dependent dehydrogenase (short-subunit alcohol dehydrogenase family) [Sphingobium sp. JAI105]PSO13108.1 oxidoreductase [Sphingobium sp. AEW4]TWD05786.1 NAD(P)-dependent dehydrogenase (short-subunit alcohol dehydrogenase family) [Sphingobium sp. AEW010]TWD23339.1 NAD(P)-dependent dehydrogenase (short-subunit alcohol dehydrogenase family) [Sphingobium sp. AEW013]TWD25199.1 NAD(P)-dependent dehydrogenase (short-subunit alcohol dehydrogenase family) [Sphingobium sp. AEW001]